MRILGFQKGYTQTTLLGYRDYIENLNLASTSKMFFVFLINFIRHVRRCFAIVACTCIADYVILSTIFFSRRYLKWVRPILRYTLSNWLDLDQGRRSVGPGYNIFANGISRRRFIYCITFCMCCKVSGTFRLLVRDSTPAEALCRHVICCLEPIQPSLDMAEKLFLTGTVT